MRSEFGIYYCDVKVHDEGLNSYWSSYLQNAVNNWLLYGGHHYVPVYESISNSNVDVTSEANWLQEYGLLTYAITLIYDEDGNCIIDGVDDFAQNGLIDYALIKANSDYNNSSWSDKTTILTHELGHVVGLGHCPSYQTSVMPKYLQYMSSTPQKHDRDDLEDFYH